MITAKPPMSKLKLYCLIRDCVEEELAERVGIDVPTLREYKDGLTPPDDVLHKLATALNCDTEEIIGRLPDVTDETFKVALSHWIAYWRVLSVDDISIEITDKQKYSRTCKAKFGGEEKEVEWDDEIASLALILFP
jgi:transcriptional regulator with XRE-family HTH domain